MSDRSNVQEQIDHYKTYAERFERSIWTMGSRENRNHRVKVSRIAEAIEAAKGGTVLEVGVGSGLHAQWLLENTPVEYTGVDASVEMLALARRRLERFEGRFRLGIADAHRLPIADGAFDATFCSGTLHHLTDPARGMREIVRTVKPGGLVAVMEPNWKFPSMLAAGLLVPAERNVFRLTGPKMLAWAQTAGLEATLERILYTPPKPRAWARAYDRIDVWFGKTAGLRRMSVMLFVSGRRREPIGMEI